MNHRNRGPRDGLCNVDSVVGQFCQDSGFGYFTHSPSLAQHVGETSTLWQKATTAGRRRAATFAGAIEDGAYVEAVADEPDVERPDLFETASLAVVALVEGSRHPVSAKWLLEESFPRRTSLHIGHFGEVTADSAALGNLLAADGFVASSFTRGARNSSTALNSLLEKVREDFVLIVDGSLEPVQGVVSGLFAAMAEAEIGTALVSVVYESARHPGMAAAAVSKDRWTGRSALDDIATGGLLELGYSGLGCALLAGDALREILPLHGRGPASRILGVDTFVSEALRQRGYGLRLAGSVRVAPCV